MENPWSTPAGRRAQELRTTALAAGSGEVAEFAREVVAGRASSRDLLFTSALSDRALQPVRDLVERWHRLPPADRARLEAEAANDTAARIAALNALPADALEPPPADALPADARSTDALEPPPAAQPHAAEQPPAAGRSSWPRAARRPDDTDPDEGRTFLSDAW
ncbi:hypothetical protein GCM10010492_61860 [Saccharothrix mutabilis subsp. mutabilis]|uniref:Uncharacterized protein n=1 Tax=Saccharothrix mutabilis subsp. mutabilis TaxID=66855 RepID=A0ABN0UJP3_9PSEU